MARILLIDDEPTVLKCIKTALKSAGHDIATVGACDLALKLMASMPFDVIISDYSMPGMDGLMFLEIAQRRCPGVPIIMITGYGTADTARAAMGGGAFDYLPKPVSLTHLRDTVRDADEYSQAMKETRTKITPRPEHVRHFRIVAATPAMARVCDQIEEAASRSDSVLIQGEKGTGKELIARTIHARSEKRNTHFHLIDCRTIPDHFRIGHAFAPARGGTVFFKEIHAMPEWIQEELARIIGTVAAGDGRAQNLEQPWARVMASSATPLEPLSKEGRFSPDLMGGLRRSVIEAPPLRGRTEDIRIHTGRILREMSSDTAEIASIDPDVLALLEHSDWPGNVSELQEVVRDAWIMARGGRITLNHLPKYMVTVEVMAKAEAATKVNVEGLRGRSAREYLKPIENIVRQLSRVSPPPPAPPPGPTPGVKDTPF